MIVVDLNRSSGSSASYDVAFTHALYASNPSGTLYIENDAHVVGDLYYNGDVVMKNNALVIDGVLYSDSLDCRNNSRAVSAEASEPQMPEFDSSSYDETLSEINQTATTALVVQNNDSFTMNGGIYYFTSVTLKNNAKIEGSGTIVATDGDISIQNNTTFSDDNVTLIAQGDVNLDNNTNFKEDFKIYAHGDINVRNNSDILAEALFYTDTGDIIFNNNGHFDGVILAPQGDISCQNNTIINGLIYGDYFEAKNNTHVNGSIVVNDVGMLSNQVIITYDPLQLPIETPMGIGSQESSAGGLSHSISNWYEFFD
ncbi:hypothetical protein A2526_00485 [candidate division WOR-1 bacterium RIFOXYD2_FULL_36_8]|nr:MAG: hypothetical protein A2526_00485 [candidate division WOR-1 bacterium RIFOXYD2_FULL_36_8]